MASSAESEVADYTEAIRLDPKHVDAYINRGAVYDDKLDYDKALADFNREMSRIATERFDN